MRYRILSIPVSLAAVALAHFLNTPNPMMVLIIPVVFFCYADGYIGGALSGLVAVAYSLYFFSNPGDLFTYNELNVQKVLTIVAAVSVIVVLVGKLKARDAKAIEDHERHVLEMKRINADLDLAVIEAQKASRAKSQFLSSVSHDIRTPMNVILGMTNLAMDEISNPRVIADYLDKINSSGHFLLSLINDVLDMSKIESGELEFYPGKYVFQDFVSDIRTMFNPLCEQKGLDLAFDVACAPTTTVMVDKVRFKQIFFNLVSNAVKFTEPSGRITFSIKCGQEREGLLPCAFVVADTGIGMSLDYQQHMFEPFTQEANRHLVKSQGTGLGLPIVKSIVEALGGTIAVDSREGRGTAITIDLVLPVAPYAPEEAGDGAPVQIDWAVLAGKHVLLAEDNPLNSRITQNLLQKKGVEVTCAENGRQALEAFVNSQPGYFNAILMDIRMPEMDGLESTARIRALDREDAGQVPIIAMTANAFDDDVEKSIRGGMNRHLTKPTKPAVLYDTLALMMK